MTKTTSIRISCEECNGTGYDSGSLRDRETCLVCKGSGHIDFEEGDVITYRDENTFQPVTATIIEFPAPDYIAVHVEGSTNDETSPQYDEPWISSRNIIDKVPYEVYIGTAPDLLAALTLNEKMVASIAIANYRKEQKEVA